MARKDEEVADLRPFYIKCWDNSDEILFFLVTMYLLYLICDPL